MVHRRTRPSKSSLLLWALLAVVVAPLMAKPARAYILPTEFLCRLVADSHKNALKDVTLTLNLEVPEGAPPQEERLYLKRPERMRFVSAPGKNLVMVAREALETTFTDGKSASPRATQDLMAALIFPKGRDLDEVGQRMMQAIASIGVDTSVVTLARHSDGVAYIIGAHVWETGKPQIWIDKQSYMPVRLRVIDRDRPRGAQGVPPPMKETRLLNYAAGFPRLFEVYEDDQLVRRSEVIQVAVNQNLPESLFDVKDRSTRP